MNRVTMDVILPFFNKVHNSNPILYRHLYFGYKRITEASRITFLKTYVRQGDIVVDVGANIGFYTQILSNIVGKTGEVHAFEPDLTNFDQLKLNVVGFPNITLNKLAVSNKSGKVNLYTSTDRNTDHQTFDIGQNRKHAKVPSISLDDYFSKNIKINLVKLDIQGFDYFALMGMKRLLSHSPKVIFLGEFWPYALSRSGVDPLDYIQNLKKLGFKFIDPPFRKKSEVLQNIDNPYYFSDFIATKS